MYKIINKCFFLWFGILEKTRVQYEVIRTYLLDWEMNFHKIFIKISYSM